MATLGVIGNCFSVDDFASGNISKCARFSSKRFTPCTGGVDFFMHELSSEDFFWAVSSCESALQDSETSGFVQN